MSVEIDPLELGFHRPFTVEVSQTLRIKNPNHTPVAFKVKTTAPKQYCVRPNSGRIEPGKEVEVTVLLQALKQELPVDAKCKDKFLVQSVAVTADKEFANIVSIWQHVDNADKSSVQEKKIRVVFLPAIGSESAVTPQRNGANGYQNSEDHAPPAYRSPSPEDHYTPQARSVPTEGLVSTIDSEPASSKNSGEARASASNSTMSSSSPRETTSSTADAISNSIPTSVEDLQAQLAQAKATIATYTQERGLRMRKATGLSEYDNAATAEVMQQQIAAGVPIRVVAALCLFSFLLAYLFF